MKKLSIITLTWNQLEKATKPYIKNLYEFTNPDDFELIIIDNGSTDGTVEYLKQLEKEKTNVKVIYNSENLGYSKGNNQGIKIAEGEVIGLFNNDIYFNDKKWLNEILDFIEKTENIGLVSLRALSIYNNCNLKKYLNHKYRKQKTAYSKVFQPFFCCVLMKKQLIEEIGLLDENFTPAFYEDTDYSFRVIKKGKYNYIYNDINIFHKCQTTSYVFNKNTEKNQKYYFKKHGYLAEYIDNLYKQNYEISTKQTEIEKTLFWFLIAFELRLKNRFKKIFRGLIWKLR